MGADISVSCAPAGQVSTDMADSICHEFQGFLAEKFPQRSFVGGAGTGPAIALTVTKANERSLGLEVIWITADGARTTGVPLSTAFFDRNSDEILRRRFYEKFLNENPLPF